MYDGCTLVPTYKVSEASTPQFTVTVGAFLEGSQGHLLEAGQAHFRGATYGTWTEKVEAVKMAMHETRMYMLSPLADPPLLGAFLAPGGLGVSFHF